VRNPADEILNASAMMPDIYNLVNQGFLSTIFSDNDARFNEIMVGE
jgi:hypothetical protein